MMSARNRNPRRGFRLSLLLAGGLSLSACVVESPAYYRQGPHGQEGRIDGFVTVEGRCPTLRDHATDQVFALAGNTRALRPGDHVALSERAVGGRACGVDTPTLEVLSVDIVWRGDDHRAAWFDASRDGDFNGFIAANRDRGGWYAERYAYLNGGGGGAGRPGPGEPPRMDDRDDGDDEEQEELSVTGRLDLGGSCPAIHTPNGDSWDLTGSLGDARDGDRVRILGVTAGRSACGGRALRINEIQER